MKRDAYTRDTTRRRHRWKAQLPGTGAGGSGNVWTFSTELDNAVWSIFAISAREADVASDPAGTTKADRIVETADTLMHFLARAMVESQNGQPQSVIAYAKADQRTELAIRFLDYDGLFTTSRVNLITGAVVAKDARHTLDVQDMGNGWWFVRATLDSAGTANPDLPHVPTAFFHLSTGPNLSYAGSTSAGLLLFNLQYFPNNNGALLAPQYAKTGSLTNILRFGMNSGLSIIGKGPGGSTTNPYRAIQGQPTPTGVVQNLADAKAADVLLILNLAGSPGAYMDAQGNFDWSLYEARVRRFQNIPELAQAVAEGRVLFWVIDEANAAKWSGSISPRDVNDMGLLHKTIWPGCYCLARMSADTLADGWSNNAGLSAPPTSYVSPVTGQSTGGGWTGLDYGWFQMSHQHYLRYTTVAEAYSDQKARLLAVDLGMIPGLNIWNGGIMADFDGIESCWDYANNRSSSGVIIGPDNTDTDFADWQQVNCGNPNLGNNTSVVASPVWIEHVAATIFSDPDYPCFMLWVHAATSGSPVSNAEAITLEGRSDVVAGLSVALAKCNSRALFNGLRPVKLI